MLGTQLRRLRKRKRWSQECAARLAGVAMNTWARWERDESNPGLASLEKIAKALGTTVAEIVK